jgi:endonuclease YncB( thermonuclease family)
MGTLTTLKRPQQMIMRAAGFALAAGTVGAALFGGALLRDPARLPPPQPSTMAATPDAKDATRVTGAIGHGPVSAPNATAPVGSGAAASAAPSGEPGAWREEEFTFAEIVDGRTLSADGVTITLAGLALPHSDQICRTLDDRLEPCAARAATQLELLTRSRRLACRFQMVTASAGAGSCRIGSQDLAERMIRTGYVRADKGEVVADAGEPGAAGR